MDKKHIARNSNHTIFLLFPNKSNVSIYIIIPVITSLQAKYLLGDLDKGYQWTVSDIFYWVSLYSSSVVTIWIYKTIFFNNKIIK